MSLSVGNVIRLRERVWRVDAVSDVDFTATPLDGRDARRWRFLRAFEEANAEEGSFPPPDSEKISSPDEQDLLLRAHRLGMVHASAPFLGLQRSRAIPEAYQLVPLLMALNQQKVRLLIGDDVGIGKSIEAGLIASELIARGTVERVLLLLPASLRDQWQETLDRFFHLQAVVMSGENRPALERQLLPGQSPWAAFPYVISSIDYVKTRIGEVLQHKWDLVLVDEAHLSQRPHAWGGSDLQKKRWDLLREVGKSPNVQNLLLLTATPHPGHTDSYASLLEVLNEDLVSDGSINRTLAEKHVVQRRREDIQNWFGDDAPFPNRMNNEPVLPLKDQEQNLLASIREYGSTLQDTEGKNVGQWVALHLQRRALSSPGAIKASLTERLKNTRKLVERNMEPVATKEAEAEATVIDWDSTRDDEDEERFRRLDGAALHATQAEIKQLEDLQKLAKKVTPAKDGKLAYLKENLPKLLIKHTKAKRVLIFTRYKDTLDYVAKELTKLTKKGNPLEGVEIVTIDGSMNQKARREEYREFEHHEKAVCIATDCISEGLDLQRGCAELIHYELPWNPNRLEQRNGRLDRYGQPEKEVGITTLVREDELDVTMLEVLVKKAAAIRDQYGFCPIFFSSAKELKKLIKDYGTKQKQLELGFDADDMPGAIDDEDADIDVTTKERLDKIKTESFYGQESIRLPEVEKALKKTYEAVGNPVEITSFIQSALALVNADLDKLDEDTWKVGLKGTTYAELGDEDGKLTATFSPKIARDEPDLELLDLAHPLVRRLVDDIRHSALGSDKGRIACRGSKLVEEVTAVVQVLARFVTESTPPVLMEELIPIAYLPYGDKPVDADPWKLIRSEPAPLNWSKSELSEQADEAMNNKALETLIKQAVEQRRKALEERQKDMAEVAEDWAEGMDKVTLASRDLLTLTMLIPV